MPAVSQDAISGFFLSSISSYNLHYVLIFYLNMKSSLDKLFDPSE